jgi:hypothetical protein
MEPTTSTTEAQQDLEDSPSLQQHEEGHEQDHALDPLFQDVIFYLNPFLGSERIAEVSFFRALDVGVWLPCPPKANLLLSRHF